MNLKLCETKKLHYGKYLYKLVLSNKLNIIFRTDYQKNGNLSFARERLDAYTENYRRGEPIERQVYRTSKEVPILDYLDAKHIYTCLKDKTDYKIRIESWGSMIIYSNDKPLLLKIANKLQSGAKEFWEPNHDYIDSLLSNNNIILVDTPPEFPIRITLGRYKVDSSFAKWLRANRDKSRIGDIALKEIETSGLANGLYFYVRDEKILNLVSIIIGHNIRRIDKLIYKENIDK